MSRKEEKSRADIYARITDRIVADLERGVRPWITALDRRQHRRAHHAAAAPQRPTL